MSVAFAKGQGSSAALGSTGAVVLCWRHHATRSWGDAASFGCLQEHCWRAKTGLLGVKAGRLIRALRGTAYTLTSNTAPEDIGALMRDGRSGRQHEKASDLVLGRAGPRGKNIAFVCFDMFGFDSVLRVCICSSVLTALPFAFADATALYIAMTFGHLIFKADLSW